MGVFFGRMVFSSVPLGGGAALLFLAVEAAFRLDVDFPAGELGGQAGVLPLVADGQGKLVVRHSHPAGAGAVLRQLYREHVGRRERRRDELLGLLAVLHNVDLLAAQLVHNL